MSNVPRTRNLTTSVVSSPLETTGSSNAQSSSDRTDPRLEDRPVAPRRQSQELDIEAAGGHRRAATPKKEAPKARSSQEGETSAAGAKKTLGESVASSSAKPGTEGLLVPFSHTMAAARDSTDDAVITPHQAAVLDRGGASSAPGSHREIGENGSDVGADGAKLTMKDRLKNAPGELWQTANLRMWGEGALPSVRRTDRRLRDRLDGKAEGQSRQYLSEMRSEIDAMKTFINGRADLPKSFRKEVIKDLDAMRNTIQALVHGTPAAKRLVGGTANASAMVAFNLIPPLLLKNWGTLAYQIGAGVNLGGTMIGSAMAPTFEGTPVPLFGSGVAGYHADEASTYPTALFFGFIGQAIAEAVYEAKHDKEGLERLHAISEHPGFEATVGILCALVVGVPMVPPLIQGTKEWVNDSPKLLKAGRWIKDSKLGNATAHASQGIKTAGDWSAEQLRKAGVMKAAKQPPLLHAAQEIRTEMQRMSRNLVHISMGIEKEKALFMEEEKRNALANKKSVPRPSRVLEDQLMLLGQNVGKFYNKLKAVGMAADAQLESEIAEHERGMNVADTGGDRSRFKKGVIMAVGLAMIVGTIMLIQPEKLGTIDLSADGFAVGLGLAALWAASRGTKRQIMDRLKIMAGTTVTMIPVLGANKLAQRVRPDKYPEGLIASNPPQSAFAAAGIFVLMISIMPGLLSGLTVGAVGGAIDLTSAGWNKAFGKSTDKGKAPAPAGDGGALVIAADDGHDAAPVAPAGSHSSTVTPAVATRTETSAPADRLTPADAARALSGSIEIPPGVEELNIGDFFAMVEKHLEDEANVAEAGRRLTELGLIPLEEMETGSSAHPRVTELADDDQPKAEASRARTVADAEASSSSKKA